MAFLDNPAIILAHIRQSHVTSDDTGMCEMVLIDQDVDLEKCHLTQVPGSGYESAILSSLNEGFDSMTDGYTCDLSQSMDITSSWDFGIRRRSNTAQRLERLRKERQNQIKCKNIQWKERSSQSVEDLGSFFEKRDIKDRMRSTCVKSTLSLRLEQCPQQLNNPFNEYSKFDGKGHIGTTATKKIDVYLSMQMGQEKVHPMAVVTIANARVHDLIGLICWQYTTEGREPKLNENVNAYCLHIAEDDGEVDTDFPPLDSNEPIHKFGFSTLALVEKYTSPGLGSRQSLFVRISFSSVTYPTMTVSSENFWMWQCAVSWVKSEVYRVTRKGESTVPWGTPVLQRTTSDSQRCNLIYCGLLVRKSVVHAARRRSTPAFSIFTLSSDGWIVLKALEKSNNTILLVLPMSSR
ncbi:target of rapamycin complex 2 subunit MAPKAP1 isoform X5 [Syngnathus scovelli]|uniref:target of rapamycin complex 2 subunit MAPKAP1 isoform X5 n=1 Tax=Syngnathus scovelli TaxID=161590 RepID=UPI0035CACBD2